VYYIADHLEIGDLMLIKKIPSVIPYYVTGLSWVLYALIFPMYRWLDFLMVIVLSAAVFCVCKKIFPGKEIILEVPHRTGDDELDRIYSQVFQSIKEMRELNGDIKGEGISRQIDQLEIVTKSILDVLEKEPDKANQIRRFLNYYLPTTIKLLTSYKELAAQQNAGENIKGSMAEIENVMETIVEAFKKELDSLFLGKAMDISAEIQVLESMMKSQGFK